MRPCFPRAPRAHWLALVWAAALAWTAGAAGGLTPADDWVAETPVYPAPWTGGVTNGFDALRCEGIAGKLKVTWTAADAPTNTTVVLWHSLDAPGRWQARAWRSLPMLRRTDGWDATVPVPHLDLPMVYFVAVRAPDGSTKASAMRVCHPRLAGLEEIARPFWPFLEGFEEGLENWRWQGAAPPPKPLALHPGGYNGYHALQVSLPAPRQTVAVATTVVRGWHLELFNARGLRVWTRTLAGEGTLRLAFLTDYATTNQMLHLAPAVFTVGPRWNKAEVLFDDLPEALRGRLDLVIFEFQAGGPREFLLDDLSLLGRWRLDLEK